MSGALCNSFKIIIAVILFAHSSDSFEEDLSERPECMNIRKCGIIWNKLVKAPRPLEDNFVSYLKEIQCGFEGKDPNVLCPAFDDEQNFPPNLDHLRSSNRYAEHENYHLLPTDCGPPSLWDYFVLNHGTTTHLNEYPWMALLRYRTANGLEFLCQGSLINEKYILTAASCVTDLAYDTILVAVRLGEFDLSQISDCEGSHENRECNPPFQEITIEKIHYHPMYYQQILENNIALLRLAWAADTSHVHVKPICLPNDETELMQSGFGIIAGWDNSETLQYKNCSIISSTDCTLAQSLDPQSTRNDEMCAYETSGSEVQFCVSGNPFFIFLTNDFKYMQLGILNHAPRVCDNLSANQQYPYIFTRVHHHMKWILDTVRP